MIVRFGYVALPLNLHNGSPNKTITYKRFTQLPDKETQLYKLKSLVKENLDATRRILIYNKAHDIMLYRFTSKLVPLVTHEEVFEWNYIDEFKAVYDVIGSYVKENNLRVSAHPDHFTVINTPNQDIFRSSLKDLEYHANIFEAMNLSEKEAKLVLHVGGTYGNKEKSTVRFVEQFSEIDKKIRDRIILENDDKSYTAKEVLKICKELSIPMVLDIHHHWCNSDGEKIENLLEDIFDTWRNEVQPPKIHASSPKCLKQPKAHADFVDVSFLMEFINKAKDLDYDFDVMIEAKKKDDALFKLMEDLKLQDNIEILSGASIKYKTP
ncbi:UV DNA damage repair endonuclease UvsE [Alkaliphilus peptidifermentans]|uniref:UV-damage endonuclease n=1 Tax=Alkaliphilus peptidifermentans DSM 18978 TaxID=1120976 RepID=A0A1G5KKR5_9FIRM|nr:UV DNA damage repair endonuclease UvsE [Alkaliphilus peptidifermentans]SCZ00811.1 UV-damage endonuclease [Alkaliphilus peptidifermentans DSM 18978]